MTTVGVNNVFLPDIQRTGLCRKGVFTRERQPKNSAYLLRKRYWSLAQEIDNATIPADLEDYVTDKHRLNDEL